VPRVSIIIPALDEAGAIAATLDALATLRAAGCEVIVVDGGSSDHTLALAASRCDRAITAQRGRAAQMNAGAQAAGSGILLFLHADTVLPAGALEAVEQALASGRLWGRFDITLAGRHRLLPLVAAVINLRSRISGIATGDQAMFMTRAAYQAVGGFDAIPLMEDLAISRRLKRLSPPACLRNKAVTSARRWESRGLWRTVFLMWRLRLAYFFGAEPEVLARRYLQSR
jgi:rSAM/selenodomain-associated transferase 2